MYLSSCPGGFEQLSFYDAIRGELYRDFADPIAMVARTLVEGLFGIKPNALQDTLTIEPGLPADWKDASLNIPDISIAYKKKNTTDYYTIIPSYSKKMRLCLKVKARMDGIASILVNGSKASFKQSIDAIDLPTLQINAAYAPKYSIEIVWKSKSLERLVYNTSYKAGDTIQFNFQKAGLLKLFDPQEVLQADHGLTKAIIQATTGNKTFFVQLQQGQFTWWQPVSFLIKDDNTDTAKKAVINSSTVFEKISLANYYNDKINHIFKQQYLSPRPVSPTLQLPTQGIGNWCYPLINANINDVGLRKLAGNKNEIITPQLVPFSTPADPTVNNILFTSQWDNYPKQASIPLNGSASHIHLLMAGSTNAMQSRLVNGEVIVEYKDGTADTLQLKNPESWWPIEQDYYIDGFAFTTGAPVPLRLYLQTGKFGYGLEKYATIKGFSNRAIEGGAAIVLDMALNPAKELQGLLLKTIANDVVIGIMSVTLQR
ncbi:MAG: hypothetical protein JWP81_5015 [Ferruginibacter sp.]|nr:hypothetical protein [Ferruginibacter sp.]